jgi:hypothetical protein
LNDRRQAKRRKAGIQSSLDQHQTVRRDRSWSQLAFWLTASLLIGAFCASLAATEGGSLRDGARR